MQGCRGPGTGGRWRRCRTSRANSSINSRREPRRPKLRESDGSGGHDSAQATGDGEHGRAGPPRPRSGRGWRRSAGCGWIVRAIARSAPATGCRSGERSSVRPPWSPPAPPGLGFRGRRRSRTRFVAHVRAGMTNVVASSTQPGRRRAVRPRRPSARRRRHGRSVAGAAADACAAGGALAAAVVAVVGPWWLIPLAGWDAAAGALLGWTWRSLWPNERRRGPRATRHAKAEPRLRDLILLSGSLISLVAVGLVLVRREPRDGPDERDCSSAMSVASIVLAWAVVHTVSTRATPSCSTRASRRESTFNEDASPDYADFLYLALTIGMDLPGLRHQSHHQGDPPARRCAHARAVRTCTGR